MLKTNISHDLYPDAPPSGELTPDVAMQLNDYIEAQGFYLRGHGTPVEDVEAFFDEGIITTDGYMTTYDDLGNISIGISVTDPEHPDSGQQITNMEFMNDWPHKKYTKQPNVVLMAVPSGDPERHISGTVVNEYLLDCFDEEAFPPELIAGFYSPANGQIQMNPKFNINPDEREKFLQKIQELRADELSRFEDFDNPAYEYKHPIDLSDTDPSDDDWI